jgi:hypothetical protein
MMVDPKVVQLGSLSGSG